MAPSTPPDHRRIVTPRAPRFAPAFDEDLSQISQQKSTRALAKKCGNGDASDSQFVLPISRNSHGESASSASSSCDTTTDAKGKGRFQEPVTPKSKITKPFTMAAEYKSTRKRSASDASDEDASSSEEFTPRKRHLKHDCHVNKPTIHGLPVTRSARGKKVQIYTDSKERLPELDMSPSNPFVRPAGGNTVELPYQGPPPKSTAQLEWEKAIKYNEGILWSFRGEKFLRRWDKSAAEGEEPQPDKHIGGSDCHNQSGLRIAKHTAKTYLRPRRLLFTPAEMRSFALTGQTHPQADLDEEDIMNDNDSGSVDDSSSSGSSSSGGGDDEDDDGNGVSSDVDSESDEIPGGVKIEIAAEEPAALPAITPAATGPAQPTTATATGADDTTVAVTHDGPSTNTRSRSSVASPFDHWPRTKSRASSSRTRSEKGASSQDPGSSQNSASSQHSSA